MDILLIGNGFDLEHKLPTTYRDFLCFCDAVSLIGDKDSSPQLKHSSLRLFWDTWDPPTVIRGKLLHALYSQNDSKSSILEEYSAHIVSEVFQCIHDNVWFHYFKKRLSSMGENWIDFEKEISYVIQMLEGAHTAFHKYPNPHHFPDKFKEKLEAVASGFDMYWLSMCQSRESILNFSQTLSQHLDSFIRALEIYLSAFIDEVQIAPEDVSPDVKPLHPDKVLSFNYTNTYAHTHGQGREIEYCYIHGKAELPNTVESCNLVLGIDEYLADDRKNSDLEFLHFKKYYQRIYKSTDNSYLKWIDEIRSYPEDKHTLYIFGHSLDVTDKDVLHQLICNDNVQTKIFYYRKHKHDKSVLGQLIHNLVRVIGQDELIRRTGGSHKTIEFIPQTLHE